MIMCHMVADSLEELHSMADAIGIRRQWFQSQASYPHYDICKAKRAQAISRGAVEVTGREMIRHCQRLKTKMESK